METLYTIDVQDIETVRSTEVTPGDIIPQGIILRVEEEGPTVWMYTPGNQSVWARNSDTVQVYGHVSPEILTKMQEIFPA